MRRVHIALRWRGLPQSEGGRAAIGLICPAICLGKCSLESTFATDVCVNIVKCYLFWFFSVYIDDMFFLV